MCVRLSSLRELKADLWVFDCDGVIYKNLKDAETEVVRSMIQFLASKYVCSEKEAQSKRAELLKKHNVPHSIMAFVREGFDEQEVLEKTYFTINLENIGIQPSLSIQKLFSSLVGKKVMLTNNHAEWALRILRKLEIENHFSHVLGINELGLIQKPKPEAFQLVQDSTKINKNVVFVDDELKNVVAANDFGWTAVWITNTNSYDGLFLPELC